MGKATEDANSAFQQIDTKLTKYLAGNEPLVNIPLGKIAEGIPENVFDHAFPRGGHRVWIRVGRHGLL